MTKDYQTIQNKKYQGTNHTTCERYLIVWDSN